MGCQHASRGFSEISASVTAPAASEPDVGSSPLLPVWGHGWAGSPHGPCRRRALAPHRLGLPLPAQLRTNEVLWDEGLAGSLYTQDFLRICRQVGFLDPRQLASHPIQVGAAHAGAGGSSPHAPAQLPPVLNG